MARICKIESAAPKVNQYESINETGCRLVYCLWRMVSLPESKEPWRT